MSLSEQEQRVLREIERSLMADDPTFGASVRGDHGGSSGALTLRGVAVVAVGLVILVAGVALSQTSLWFVALGVLGFLVMLGGAIWMLKSDDSGSGRSSARAPKPRPARDTNGLGSRMEDNFKRRFEN